MSVKMRQIRWMGIFFCMMALGFIMTPVSSCAVEKDAASISALEKKMLSPSTKKIQYRRGKIRSVAHSKWKKAQKISRTADSLAIKRKGWYTICVTTKSGKKKLTELYFYKKNYENKEIDKTSSTGIILNHIIIFIIEGIFYAFILYLLQKQIIERQLYKLYSKILKKDDSMLDSSYNEPLYLKVLEKLI